MMRANPQTRRVQETTLGPDELDQACADRDRRQGPTGRCAVGLRPSPDTDPCIDAPAGYAGAQEKTPAILLTGSAPSG